jgi:NADH-quinone oxidoreductase subunit G
VAAHATRGLTKMGGELVATTPGQEAAALDALEVDGDVVILVGERLAGVHGALSAALRLAERTGAKLAWVPRRAGDRGAVETGCLPTLLPGGRPVADAEARADLAAAWGVESLPARAGRDTSAIIEAAASHQLGGLVVGGVEVADLPDPARAREALEAAFVVSLEVRESDVTRAADVVLPVAPVVEKAGMFVSWEGRLRPFEAVLESNALTDVRVLAGIAEEMESDLGFRSIEAARARMVETGPWDGTRTAAPHIDAADTSTPAEGTVVLETWRQIIDDGRGQDGQLKYHATARPAVLRASAATLTAAKVEPGADATISTDIGNATFASEVADLPDGVVCAPANSCVNLRAALGAGHGDAVTLVAGGTS